MTTALVLRSRMTGTVTSGSVAGMGQATGPPTVTCDLLICVHEHSVPTAPRTLPYNYPFVKETHHSLISLDPLTLTH